MKNDNDKIILKYVFTFFKFLSTNYSSITKKKTNNTAVFFPTRLTILPCCCDTPNNTACSFDMLNNTAVSFRPAQQHWCVMYTRATALVCHVDTRNINTPNILPSCFDTRNNTAKH